MAVSGDANFIVDGGVLNNFPTDIADDEFWPDIWLGPLLTCPFGLPFPKGALTQAKEIRRHHSILIA